jgi:hypothetical protein
MLLAAMAAAAIELHGQGVQVYTCGQTPTGLGWHLVAPDADLFDTAGNKVGHHAAGPSWQANDGSVVTGEVVASSTAPKPGAIPWLVLRAKSHTGQGLFTPVTFIVRASTDGGIAPATGCDSAHAGNEARVPYSATYILLPGDGNPPP